MSKDDYDRYYADESEHAKENPYLGIEDEQGDYWVCGMPSEEANKFIMDHTNEDGSIDYAGMEKDIFGEDYVTGKFDEGVYRVDFDTEGEIRPTSPENSPNLSGECEGDGKLPDGKSSDHECKNVPRENITKAEEVKGTAPQEDPEQASTEDYDMYSGIY